MSQDSKATAPEPSQAVWLDLDQAALDAAYDQNVYAPNMQLVISRYAASSEEMRHRIGHPRRVQYGPSEVEQLDIYRTHHASAPVFLFIHGGAWRGGAARDFGFPAEMLLNAGMHYVAIDFANITEAGGDLRVMAEQVRRAVAWVWRNAESFGGNRDRLYVGGHSSGAHLCGVALTTDWRRGYRLPPDCIKGGLCMSGMFDLKPVRLSKRSLYVNFTDEIEHGMSAQRHLDLLRAPVIITYGTNETPEFQRQSRDFVAAATLAGKRAQLVAAPHFNHFEMCESLGNPYGPNGRAALALVNLTPD